MSPKELTVQWIQYLKGNGIANKQSKADGKLIYLRNVTSADLTKFLELHTDFDPKSIKNAINTVIKNKKPGTALAPQRQQPQADAQQQPQQPALPGPQQQQPPRPSSRFNTDDAEDIEPHEPTRQQQQKPKPKVKPIGRDSSGKMRYAPVNEDIRDAGQPEFDEDDVEAVFKMLTNPPKQQPKPKQGSKYPFKNAKMPNQSGEDAKAQELEEFKSLISEKMTSEQRKMLWDLLQPSTVAEAFANKSQIENILTGISKTGRLSLDELKTKWQEDGRPETTDGIKKFLKKLGYNDIAVEKSMTSVLGPQGDDDESDDDYDAIQSRANEGVKQMAAYIKKVGMADEIIQFLKTNFADDVTPKPGMFQKMKNFSNKMFGRKVTTEEIRRIFDNILKEDRKNLPEIHRLIEASKLGRSRKK